MFAPGTHVEAPYFYVCMYEHIRATHAPARLSAWEVGQRSASLLYVDVDLRELGHARVVACGGHARACRVGSQVLGFTER